MSTPFEEIEALKRAEKFLVSLLNPKETPGVPKAIRKTVAGILRHYPGPTGIEIYWSRGRRGN